MSRDKPNVLITGTPGTGKSTMVQALIERVPTLRAVDITALVRDKQLHTGWDDEYKSYILDEDRVRRCGAHAHAKLATPVGERTPMCPRRDHSQPPSSARHSQLLDEMEEEMEEGGRVVEYHGAELFPERWFDLVLVLRTDNSVLYGRLESRCTRMPSRARIRTARCPRRCAPLATMLLHSCEPHDASSTPASRTTLAPLLRAARR